MADRTREESACDLPVERVVALDAAAPRASVFELLRRRAIGSNVLALGFTSLFTDVSSEMVAAILPIWLVREMQFGTLEFGAIDGLWRGVAGILGALVALGSDRRRRYKLTAAVGYAVSAVSRVTLLFLPVAWVPVALALLLDRLGKGLRTPARDALISFASVPSARATAFGVHRALDAVGRLAGPLMAFAVLKMAPKAFDAVFFVSICFALIGLATITLLVVDERSSTSGSGEESQVSSLPNARLAPTAIGPLAPAANSSLVSATIGIESRSKARFRWWVISATVLSAVAIGEAFFVLVLERRGAISADSVPLFFTGLGLAQIVLTLPCSRLADRIGRKRVWVGGQVVLLAAYAALLFGGGAANLVWIGVLLLGLHLAATDGVSSALTSLFVSTERRAVGLAIVAGAAGLAELGASIGFGAAWAWRGLDFGLGLFAACAAAGILVAVLAPWSDLTASHVDCP